MAHSYVDDVASCNHTRAICSNSRLWSPSRRLATMKVVGRAPGTGIGPTRHCQGNARLRWLEARAGELLPTRRRKRRTGYPVSDHRRNCEVTFYGGCSGPPVDPADSTHLIERSQTHLGSPKVLRLLSNCISLRRPVGFLQVPVSKALIFLNAKTNTSVSRGRSRYSPRASQY